MLQFIWDGIVLKILRIFIEFPQVLQILRQCKHKSNLLIDYSSSFCYRTNDGNPDTIGIDAHYFPT